MHEVHNCVLDSHQYIGDYVKNFIFFHITKYILSVFSSSFKYYFEWLLHWSYLISWPTKHSRNFIPTFIKKRTLCDLCSWCKKSLFVTFPEASFKGFSKAQKLLAMNIESHFIGFLRFIKNILWREILLFKKKINYILEKFN